jgi:Double zinc ribbon/PHF5-like protein
VFDDRMTDDQVERLHGRLVDALRRLRPDPFGSPVTVAEIYQDLVPYRSVRTELGFDMNADYEHTLLRLLAGEEELARLEPTEARDELRAELDSPNPNVGLFRKFAACDVWIARTVETAQPRAEPEIAAGETWDPRGLAWEEDGTDAPTPAAAGETGQAPPEPVPAPPPPPPEAGWTEERAETELLLEEAVDEPDAPAPAEAITPPEVERVPMASTPPSDRAAPAQATPDAGGACPYCDASLPSHRAVRFCPFCGADQTTSPCVACGEPIEAAWKFCVACGAEAPAQAGA